MDLLKLIREDLAKGFSKKQMENLIGLPENCLSNVLSGKKKLSVLSELKVKKFMENPKPDPLNFAVPKKKKEESFKGIIPTILEGKPVVNFPPPAKPFTLENFAEELTAGIDTYHPQPQIKAHGLDGKLNEALIEIFQGTMVEIYRKLLDFAKSGASREEVEKRIAQHPKLTPGQKTMIRSQIKTNEYR